jgi:hypothetical protein
MSIGRAYTWAEYETNRGAVIPWQAQLQNSDAACALCLVPAAYTLMIPGAVTSCPPGFHQEYFGWLMSTHFTQLHPTEFSCVSAFLDSVNTSVRSDENGNLFYSAEIENAPLNANGEGFVFFLLSEHFILLTADNFSHSLRYSSNREVGMLGPGFLILWHSYIV